MYKVPFCETILYKMIGLQLYMREMYIIDVPYYVAIGNGLQECTQFRTVSVHFTHLVLINKHK